MSHFHMKDLLALYILKHRKFFFLSFFFFFFLLLLFMDFFLVCVCVLGGGGGGELFIHMTPFMLDFSRKRQLSLMEMLMRGVK